MTGCSRNLESSYERLTVIHYSDGSLGQNCCLWEGLLPSVNVNQFTAIMFVKHYFSIFFIASLNHHCFSCEASGRIFCFIGKFVLKESSPVSLSSLACIDHRAEGFDADRA